MSTYAKHIGGDRYEYGGKRWRAMKVGELPTQIINGEAHCAVMVYSEPLPNMPDFVHACVVRLFPVSKEVQS